MRIAIVGGGVIGLSLAWELSNRGHQITVVDQGQLGTKASWAGAGVLIPGNEETAIHPLEHLEAVSNRLHGQWSQQLLDATGIDNGYRTCGGLYVATSPGEVATLAGSIGYWQERQIEVEPLSTEVFLSRFPQLSHLVEASSARTANFHAAWMPDEMQIRNPWHLKALIAACTRNSVQLVSRQTVQRFVQSSNHLVSAIDLGDRQVEIDHCVFASGAWTQKAISALNSGISLQMVPVRGQIVLYSLPQPLELPVVNEGTRYIVPRDDGHVLVGATIEEVGFDESTSDLEIRQLAADAKRLVPSLVEARIQQSWAGLRPGTHDGFPYLGRLPGFDNAWVSTGHFKTGLQLSTGSAIAMADTIEGKETFVDLTPFDPGRVIV